MSVTSTFVASTETLGTVSIREYTTTLGGMTGYRRVEKKKKRKGEKVGRDGRREGADERQGRKGEHGEGRGETE